jgi:adenosylhomocysteine nucleosidase
MKARVAILAALPREITPLVRDWPVRKTSRRGGYMIAECDRAIAVCAGMGRERVAHALTLAAMQGPLHSVISVGYAGALRPGIVRNTIYWPATVIDAQAGERYACECGSGTLVTVDHVLGCKEKQQMAERWSADLADMEAAAVARLARMRDLPFRALKIVSDEMGDVLPDLNRFIDTRGGFRELAFASYLARHPWRIPAAVRLGRHSAQASQEMAQVLRGVLESAE